MTCTNIFKFFIKNFWHFIFLYYLCTRFRLVALFAQMAESVDALVSNTSGATRAGSTPALGTRSTTCAGLKQNEVLQVIDLQHFFIKRLASY